MFIKLLFAISHYAVFFGFLWAFWGMGRLVLGRLKPDANDPLLKTAMEITFGQGIFIVLLQCLGIFHLLRFDWIVLLLVVAGTGGVIEFWRSWPRRPFQLAHVISDMSKVEIFGLILIACLLVPILVSPLSPPLPGDELLYHLPHAQQMAQTGSLQITDWLRYPWFPFNFELLYASALIVYDAVLTHLFSMLAGLLVGLIIYRLGKRHFGVAAAIIATVIWLHLNQGDFGKSNVDLGLTLYVLAASVSFYWWVLKPCDRHWLWIAAFLMGLAVGIKYQGLLFLPIFGITLLWVERGRPRSLALALGVFLIPCIYWYARNAILAGDPFDPFGWKLFGFHDWKPIDYALQFQDLKHHAGWPNWMLWPACLALIWRKNRKSSPHTAATIFCGIAFITWFATSHVPRYLLPAYPVLALLSSDQWATLIGFMGRLLNNNVSARIYSRIVVSAAGLVVFGIIGISSIHFTGKYVRRISATPLATNRLLSKEIPGYAVLQYAKKHGTGRIYLVGSLSDAIYYAPHPIWGDVFGPWRYRDILSDDPNRFYKKLRSRKFDAVIADDSLWEKLKAHQAFKHLFALDIENGGVSLYRLRSHSAQ